ncbi:MAG: PilZ domain-containing protein [Vulcanimicrobiota bacterium]
MKETKLAKTQERRITTRVDCCYPVDCEVAGERFAGTVTNMGLGGMRLLSSRQLSSDSSLQIFSHEPGWGPVATRVVWSRERSGGDDFESGMVYRDGLQELDSSWVKTALQHLGFESSSLYERRRTLRAATSLQAQLAVAGKPYPCIMRDLGLGGALVETASPILGIQDGAAVSLEVSLPDKQVLFAKIVYSRLLPSGHQQHGLSFDPDRHNQAQARLVEGYLEALHSS